MGFAGVLCAVEAGCFAALASICAKIATSSSTAAYVSDLAAAVLVTLFDMRITLPTTQVSTILRMAGVAGIFVCNALMWVHFTKSMHLCASTLEATAFNTASNFFFTAFLGFFLFGEHIALQWYVGSILLVIGLVILHKTSPHETDLEADKREAMLHADKGVDGSQPRLNKKTE